jgi:hypothetical protein
MIVTSPDFLGESFAEVDLVSQKLSEFCQAQAREFNRLFPSTLTEAALTENAFTDLLQKAISWLREFARKVVAFFKRAWDFVTGKVKPTVEAAQAEAADPAFFKSVNPAMWQAAGDDSHLKGVTCGEVFAAPGFVHPTDTKPRPIHLCPGTGMAPAAVVDLEKKYVDFHNHSMRQVINQAKTGIRGMSDPHRTLEQELRNVLGATKVHGGYEWDQVKEKGYPYWYMGPTIDATISSKWFQGALVKMSQIEKDAAELSKNRPGELVANHLNELQRMLTREMLRLPQSAKQSLVNQLREQGNFIVQFHNGLVQGAMSGYRNLSVFVITCLHSVRASSGGADAIDGRANVINTNAKALPYIESVQYVTEGLASVVKNLATGDMEGEIDELEKEAGDIHTPEQQRYVLTKIVRLLERLIILRHNPSALGQFVHDRVAWFERVLGGKTTDAGKEMTARVGENIARLARLRDKVLAKKWQDEKFNSRVDELKNKVSDLLDKAANSDIQSID